MDKKINKILACVDFSEYSLGVLACAVELAQASHTPILVYNVINQRDVNMVGQVSKYVPDKMDVGSYLKELKNDRQAQIKALIVENFFENKSHMSFKIEVGIPADAILKTIETEAIDLVVMANKGRGNMSRFLFGSVAEKVFQHSPVPVVSVRDKSCFKRTI